jgi:SET domain-containing protein
MKEFTENNEHDIINLVDFLKSDDALIQTILSCSELDINSVSKHVATEFLKNKYNNTCETLIRYKPPREISRVELKKSNVHGNGVFATQVLEKGTIATFYPVHVMLRNNDVIYREPHNEDYYDYIYGINGQISIAGTPRICNNSTYLGHMINDGSCAKNRQAYDKYSSERSNCTFFNIIDGNSFCYCVAIIATRRIEIGEELFISYGWRYWSNRL